MPGRSKAWFCALGLVAMTPTRALADRLPLNGRLVDERGQQRPNETFRLALGSEAEPRGAQTGRSLRTDTQGRFTLETAVHLPARHAAEQYRR